MLNAVRRPGFGGRSADRQRRQKKAFDRGGPVWPLRSNAKDDRLGLGGWGGFAPPAKNRGVWGAAPPSQKRKILNYQETVFLEKLYQEKQLTVWGQ